MLLPFEMSISYTPTMAEITSQVLSETLDQVLIIRFNRPEKMNALTKDMYAELTRLLNEAIGDF